MNKDRYNILLEELYNEVVVKVQIWQNYALYGEPQLTKTIANAKVEAYKDCLALINNLIVNPNE